jgi:hypothetical protein
MNQLGKSKTIIIVNQNAVSNGFEVERNSFSFEIDSLNDEPS